MERVNVSSGTCAYCKRESELTAEHIWSDVLLRVFAAANLTIDDIRGEISEEDPLIQDLCADCNNNLVGTADQAIAKFAKRHLTGDIASGTTLDFNVGLQRWAVKTAANLQRDCNAYSASTAGRWWEAKVAFILGTPPLPPDVDVLFATWVDPRKTIPLPGGDLDLAEALGARKIQARPVPAVFVGDQSTVQFPGELQAAYALKVGSGVFYVLVWQERARHRDEVIKHCLSAGWRPVDKSRKALTSPFGMYTEGTWFSLGTHRGKLQQFAGRLAPR